MKRDIIIISETKNITLSRIVESKVLNAIEESNPTTINSFNILDKNILDRIDKINDKGISDFFNSIELGKYFMVIPDSLQNTQSKDFISYWQLYIKHKNNKVI
jgi:hypothetical protein